MSELTKGQLTIRQIITEHLEEYFSIDETNKITKEKLFSRIQDIFQSKPEIVNDSVTGRYEGYKDISHHYFSYISHNCQKEPIKNIFSDISFQAFIYEGGGSNNKRKLFMGGCRCNTTFQALC